MLRRVVFETEDGGGLWRSLVAHLTGGEGVAGSNPVSPTRHNADDLKIVWPSAG